jgi:hypothetical protein
MGLIRTESMLGMIMHDLRGWHMLFDQEFGQEAADDQLKRLVGPGSLSGVVSRASPDTSEVGYLASALRRSPC